MTMYEGGCRAGSTRDRAERRHLPTPGVDA